MSCVARPHQTPIGTASNFLQCKWVSCLRIWRPDVFRSQIYGWRDVHQGHGQLSESLLSYPPRQTSSSSSKQQQAAGKKQASSKQAASKQQASQPASKPASQQASSKQQQAAATASSRQAAAGKQQQASSKQAASKQQPAFAPLKEWTNISFKNQRDTKNWTFSRRTALKQWNRSIAKSCDDAKLELFPGARPPDTTLRNWYDLNRALVWSSKNPTEIHGFDPQKPLKRVNKSLQIS